MQRELNSQTVPLRAAALLRTTRQRLNADRIGSPLCPLAAAHHRRSTCLGDRMIRNHCLIVAAVLLAIVPAGSCFSGHPPYPKT